MEEVSHATIFLVAPLASHVFFQCLFHFRMTLPKKSSLVKFRSATRTMVFPHITVCGSCCSLCARRSIRPAPAPARLSSYTTYLTPLITYQSSHTTNLTQLITSNSSHIIHHIHSSYTTHHIQLISHNSSHPTHLTQFITSTHLTPLFTSTHLTPIILHHSSYTTHHSTHLTPPSHPTHLTQLI